MTRPSATMNPPRTDELVQPFQLGVPQAALEELKSRLARTRWPDELPGSGADYGAALSFVKTTAEYWRTTFDWRAQEARINRVPQFVSTIDGQHVHFFHVRSPEPDALPIILTTAGLRHPSSSSTWSGR